MPAEDQNGAVVRPGDRVRSTFRAPWTGVIEQIKWMRTNYVALVRLTHTRRGVPLRKPRVNRLDTAWLVKLPQEADP